MTVSPRSRRPLVNALLVSMLAHGVLLVGVVRWWPVRLAPLSSPVQAVVRGASQEGARSHPATPVMASAAIESVRRSATPATPESGRAPDRQPERASGGRSGEAEGRRKAMVQEAPRTATVAPAGEQLEGLDAAEVRQYRFALAIAARRFRPAPTVGAERNRSGTVEVAVAMPRGAAGPRVALERSSGLAWLDGDAVTMMNRAAAVAALPEGMRGRDFRIVTRLQFGPDEVPER